MAINLYGETAADAIGYHSIQRNGLLSLIMFAVPNGPKAANPLSQWIPVT